MTVSLAAGWNLQAADRFLGADTCSTSGCHGGGGENRQQFTIWSRQDPHAKSFATLTTARSARMAEALKIADATLSPRCTTCHAPFHEVPAARFVTQIKATAGVSCETCHGPAESWLRTHTRPDLTHADKVSAGVRDLKNLYIRANSCVACHQNVEADLLRAGHPELIFELDGQAVSEPKHWRETGDFRGPQAWWTGQAVALREVSWQLTEKAGDDKAPARWAGLLWLLQQTAGPDSSSPSLAGLSSEPLAENFEQARQKADALAKKSAESPWTSARVQQALLKLSGTREQFTDAKTPAIIHARRAERLVLGLDRLVAALPDKPTAQALQPSLNRLFKLAQSLPEFQPATFAAALGEFETKLKP
ncbi:MAG: hypothetical protein H7X97_14620 [Opitutaceae bacterium]|nr:hypothetical protein [Verrucomicrobiales bacterium]